MPERLDILKTYKLFINGQFPRSESGRSMPVSGPGGAVRAHACLASRKDLRDAVAAARAAAEKWAQATAYNRGQILYRLAEMLEGKKLELAAELEAGAASAPTVAARRTPAKKGAASRRTPTPRGARTNSSAARAALAPLDEVACSVDLLVAYAGWADKFAQVLGGHNPVAGPYYTFTIPEPIGVVAAVAPDAPPLLGLLALIAPALCAGNVVVALASQTNPTPACVLGEVCATSDVPPGVVNILTGERAELVPHIASHRDIDAIHAAGLSQEHAALLRAGSSENLKRVTVRALEPADWPLLPRSAAPWWIERLVEMKTVWHPVGA